MTDALRPYFKYSLAQNRQANPPDGDPTLTVEIRVIDQWGQQSAAYTVNAVNAAPSAPTGLTATALYASIGLAWTNVSTDLDLKSTKIYRSTTNDSGTASLVATVAWPACSYVDTALVTGTPYYYWLKAEDCFAQLSSFSTGATATPPTIGATDMYLYVPQFAGTVTDNSPIAGSIAWSSCSIIYKGVTYAITNNNTANLIVYWQLASPTVFSTSATLPSLGIDDFIILTNQSGTHERALISSVIEGRYIRSLSIQTDSLAAGAVTAAKITVGTLSAIKADMGTLTAGIIKMGTGTKDSDLTGFQLDSGEIVTQSAGSDLVSLDSTGINIAEITDYATDRAYKFSYLGVIQGYLAGRRYSGVNYITNVGLAIAGVGTIVDLMSNAVSGKTAQARIAVNDAVAYIDVQGALAGAYTASVYGCSQFSINDAVLYSTLATGSAPFVISSTTVCTNLNVDLLDGNHASAFLGASATAADSDKVDGNHASAFALSGHNHDSAYLMTNQNGSTSGYIEVESTKRVACGGGSTGAGTTPNGTVTLEINGTLYYLLKSASG